ncbi:hypothetical protein GCM10023146_16820 [Nocardioides caricicola]
MGGMEVHPSRARRLARAIVYAVVVAIPIALLALLVRTDFGPLTALDRELSVAATDAARSHEWIRSTAEVWEMVTQPWVVYAVIGVPLCLLAWFRLNLRTRAMWAVATMATGWLVAVLLKLLVQRSRPVIEEPLAVHHGYSFPSGHATNNAIIVTVVLLLLRPVLGVTARRLLLAIGAAWILLTSADRLFMGAHYLSDVTAGVVLGVGLCVASYAGYVGWSPPEPSDLTSKESTDDDAHQVA